MRGGVEGRVAAGVLLIDKAGFSDARLGSSPLSKLFLSSFEEEAIGRRSAGGGKSTWSVGKERRRCYGAPTGAAGTWKLPGSDAFISQTTIKAGDEKKER